MHIYIYTLQSTLEAAAAEAKAAVERRACFVNNRMTISSIHHGRCVDVTLAWIPAGTRTSSRIHTVTYRAKSHKLYLFVIVVDVVFHNNYVIHTRLANNGYEICANVKKLMLSKSQCGSTVPRPI